ncbi:uncharacterized protein DUF4240 [Amycolatopsis echigonensis]|uniref:Uncharacterized protein DUF4240 n=1 Tax=Amycolatopsis echigonensis TaxID=2576905 RepID=A0A2N3WG02_9PSEU|nr:uncharacterized protein DUF4240 [Amycolatopsis niigatensis]
MLVNTEQFWALIDEARSQASAPEDSYDVAEQACALLSARPREEIVAAQQIVWELLADSYRAPLRAAAYLVNGGCSDDGFDYFRGWLVMQGREVFERIVAAPDELAELPAAREAAADGEELECEAALGVASSAHIDATGEELPSDSFTTRYPPLDPDWEFDYEDADEMRRRLPRLAAACLS